ncbi:unnamed protein product [Acanthoscelides obtectus]|uniref:THAP-type domain-containing protein n=1 Tax=Acanthoscelides obtectus TaxID=200917 RepID=A0A9P0QCJ8_ACAOB|nr:unnamed protein product [Acanthoscelides obtectus]CAK1682613.1 hypothetical protein AOBTE_LOCUS33730 [Acanthoscelides obtectus]
MVRSCYVCKINNNNPESANLSFHRLPPDPAKHIIWISLLGIDREKTLPKLTLICSKHFMTRTSKMILLEESF